RYEPSSAQRDMKCLDRVDEPCELIKFSERLPTLKEATRLLIQEAMRRAQGNQSIAARLLGISQQALSKRLKRIGK
ncbi:helix-turn-helix domain-containing protein, partial [Candidatus Sumerlaeota bacterium]|nr:helix-turn-helix domain-containing protein [Candidatus Sumerlaeota bacterium]